MNGMDKEDMANLLKACQICSSLSTFLGTLWDKEINGETAPIFALPVEAKYPGCILTVYLVKRRLVEMQIPVDLVYVAAKSEVIIVEVGEDSRKKVSQINSKMKRAYRDVQPCGWLIVGKEHEEDGSEEKQSCR